MNTATIAALYTPEVAQLLRTSSAEAIHELHQHLLRRREDCVLQSDYSIRIRQFAPEGLSLHQLCSQRVFAWASAQLPTADNCGPESESWSAATIDFTRSTEGEFSICYGNWIDFATLLRGLQHYQRKLNRRTRRLLAQLRAYHAQQQAAEALRATMQAAAPAEPLLPTYGIAYAEYWNRIEAAEELAAQKQQDSGRPNAAYGTEILWHPDFAVGCVRSLSCMPLHEVEPFFGGNLAQTLNVGRPLDRADFLYLADCLREGVADNPTPLAALRLARALAWVERATEALLLSEQPHLTASQFDAAPALVA
jgi:hypothetical protein